MNHVHSVYMTDIQPAVKDESRMVVMVNILHRKDDDSYKASLAFQMQFNYLQNMLYMHVRDNKL